LLYQAARVRLAGGLQWRPLALWGVGGTLAAVALVFVVLARQAWEPTTQGTDHLRLATPSSRDITTIAAPSAVLFRPPVQTRPGAALPQIETRSIPGGGNAAKLEPVRVEVRPLPEPPPPKPEPPKRAQAMATPPAPKHAKREPAIYPGSTGPYDGPEYDYANRQLY
jgi:hypothetical protein